VVGGRRAQARLLEVQQGLGPVLAACRVDALTAQLEQVLALGVDDGQPEPPEPPEPPARAARAASAAASTPDPALLTLLAAGSSIRRQEA
jgi:hypothetical protein